MSLIIRSVVLALAAVISLGAQSAGTTVKGYREFKALSKKAHDVAVTTACQLNPACLEATEAWKEAAKTLPELYLSGLGQGIEWANRAAESLHHNRLFCVPDKLALDSVNYDQILESFMPTLETTAQKIKSPSGSWKSADDIPVGFALVLAMIDAFPCSTEPAL
jgi:hypothetical protein